MEGTLVTKLGGYDGRFGLKCRRGPGGDGPTHLECSDDVASLRARAERLITAGDYGCIELLSWNFELNDWVRLETLEPS